MHTELCVCTCTHTHTTHPFLSTQTHTDINSVHTRRHICDTHNCITHLREVYSRLAPSVSQSLAVLAPLLMPCHWLLMLLTFSSFPLSLSLLCPQSHYKFVCEAILRVYKEGLVIPLQPPLYQREEENGGEAVGEEEEEEEEEDVSVSVSASVTSVTSETSATSDCPEP